MKYIKFALIGVVGVLVISFQNCNKQSESSESSRSTIEIKYNKTSINSTVSGTLVTQIIGGGPNVMVCNEFHVKRAGGVMEDKTCEDDADFVVLAEAVASRDGGPDDWAYDEETDIWQNTERFPEDPVIMVPGTYYGHAMSEDGTVRVKSPKLTIR